MSKDFYVIGVGTSAGGLEALKLFFDHVPADCPHSFVVIQHLSPDHKSLMADLLAKNTQLTIHEVKDGMVIEGGAIYLLPPRMNISIENNVLYLKEKDTRSLNLPIDIFFRSLAEDQGERAIGVILTGSGSDGTRGVRAIKEAGVCSPLRPVNHQNGHRAASAARRAELAWRAVRVLGVGAAG